MLALEYFTAVMDYLEETNAKDDEFKGSVCYYLGHAYYELFNYDESLKYHNKALEIRLNVYGENHPSVAISYNNIGYVFRKKGKLDESLKYYNKALKFQLKLHGENHADVAYTYMRLSEIHEKIKDFDLAKNYAAKAKEIRDILDDK